MVNEESWYTQGTIALIQALISDQRFSIDPDRIYYSGFSYGGKGCWEFLKAAPDLFAAALCAGGWPIGQPYSDPVGSLREALKTEVARYRHIPVWIFAGEKDRMRLGSRAAHEEITAQGGTSKFTEFPATDHVPSAGKTWGNRNHITWLFQHHRPKLTETTDSPPQ